MQPPILSCEAPVTDFKQFGMPYTLRNPKNANKRASLNSTMRLFGITTLILL